MSFEYRAKRLRVDDRILAQLQEDGNSRITQAKMCIALAKQGCVLLNVHYSLEHRALEMTFWNKDWPVVPYFACMPIAVFEAHIVDNDITQISLRDARPDELDGGDNSAPHVIVEHRYAT